MMEETTMLINPTLDQLRALGLVGMAQAFTDQLENPEYHALAFEERLGMLVDREAQDRANRRLERNLKAAKLRVSACIEDIDFRHPRGLDRAVVLGLASAQWVDSHQNLIIVGPTGAGKSFLACAITQAAVRAGHTALYLRAPRLLDDLAIAHVDGRWARLLLAWSRIDVLVIDDLAIRPLTPAQAADLLEVIEDRSQRRSTVVTSQLPIAHWHESLGDATLADAILDRLTHNAHRIELRGDSLRRSDRPRAQPEAVTVRSETPETSSSTPSSANSAAEKATETRKPTSRTSGTHGT
jgi:DNA replication protein DnaC